MFFVFLRLLISQALGVFCGCQYAYAAPSALLPLPEKLSREGKVPYHFKNLVFHLGNFILFYFFN